MIRSRPTLVHCTNGYPLAGDGPEAVLAAVRTHAGRVRALWGPSDPLALGLYLPASAAESLVRGGGLRAFADALGQAGLAVHTLNGFPYASFHTPGEPRRVYRPAWDDRRRVDQTLHLAAVLAELLPEGVSRASISTLPLGWRADPVDFAASARHLREVAVHLAERRERTGLHLTVDLEPEPGCSLSDSASAIAFFDRWLPGKAEREHVGVCHDVCHAAVMFEGQAEALRAYRRAGVGVHKVQVSNAPEAVFEGMGRPMADEAVGLLRTLPGERSLRQTSIRRAGREGAFFDDLDEALAAHPQPAGRWRVHHHLPLTLASLGPLNTTRAEVADALADLAAHGEAPILETETYTWAALPPALRAASLAEGLAGELAWTRQQIDQAWSP